VAVVQAVLEVLLLDMAQAAVAAVVEMALMVVQELLVV
jgi:hypothetical protein